MSLFRMGATVRGQPILIPRFDTQESDEMRTFGRLVFSLGAVALLASPAMAQRGGGGFGGGYGALLTNKGVQKELKLDDDQVAKADKVAAEIREKMMGLREKLQDVPQEERGEKMAELMKSINDDAKKSLADVLKPEQTKRLEQIRLQQNPAQSLAEADVQKSLKLTDDQKDKIKSINTESGTQMREIFQSAQNDREGAMKRIAELRKETTAKVTGLLTADQKATWKEMTGEPYEVKFEPRPAR